MKTCTKCKEVKPLDWFAKNKRTKDGRKSYCRSCQREYRSAYNVANLIRRREYDQEYYRANANRILEYKREYRQANPEKVRATSAVRRARKRSAFVENFTPSDVVQVWGENPTCIYCQKNPAEHKDHFVPLARGGEHSLANATWPACAPCNLRKADRNPFEFIATELMNDQQRKEFAEALMRRANADRT